MLFENETFPQGSFADEQEANKIIKNIERFGLIVDDEEIDFILNADEEVEEYVSFPVISIERPQDLIFRRLEKYSKKINVKFELYDATTGDLIFSNREDNTFKSITEEGIVTGDVAQYDKKICRKSKKRKDIINRIDKYINSEEGDIDNGFSKVFKTRRRKSKKG